MRKNLMSKKMFALILTSVMIAQPSASVMAATLGTARMHASKSTTTSQTTINSNVIRMDGNDLKSKNLVAPNKSTKLYEFKINPPKDGTYEDPKTGFEVTVKFEYEKGKAKKITWTSNYPVNYVLVKGGAKGGNLYKYVNAVQSDTEIITPDNKGVGHGHVTFYFSIPTEPSEPTEPTDPEEPTDPGSGITDPEEPTDPGSGITDPEEPTDPGSGITDPGSGITDPEEPTDPGSGITDPDEPVVQDLSIIDLSQTSGFVTGGDYVTINGTGFQQGLTVTLGGESAAVVNYFDDTQIRIAIPQTSTEGPADLLVTNPDGQDASLAGAYTYLAAPLAEAPTIVRLSQTSGLVSGGDYVIVYGTGFQKGLTVTLGGEAATVVNYYNDTQIRIAIPQTSTEGPADLVVTNPDGQVASLASAYTYLAVPEAPAPTITSLSKTTGFTTGGEYVAINGTGFQQGLTVKLGGVTAQIVNFYGSTSFRIAIPKAASPGVVDLEVTNPDGKSVHLSEAYTYTVPVTTLTSLSATSGAYSGGQYVFIYGTNFDPSTVITVNNVPVDITYYSSTQIRIMSMPSGDTLGLPITGGVVPINITDSFGNSLSADFTYNAKPATPVPQITKISGAGGTAAAGSIAGGNYLYFYGTGFSSAMKVRIYNSSNILVSEAALTYFYGSTYCRYLMPKVTTAGTYTIKLVNEDGVESNGMTYIYY